MAVVPLRQDPQSRDDHLPSIPFPISVWTHNQTLQGCLGRRWTLDGSVLSPGWSPATLVPPVGLVPDRARLFAVRCGGRRDLPHHHRTGGVSSFKAGRATWRPVWSGRGRPGIMTPWLQSVVTIMATRSGDAQGRRADADARLRRRERRLGGADPRGADGGGGGVAVAGGV